MEDESSSAGLSSKAIERMEEKLQRLPSAYRVPPNEFNAFALVVAALRANSPEQAQSDLERFCRSMDTVRQDLVDAYFQQFNKAIRNYTAILATVGDAKASEGGIHEATATTAQLFRSKSQEVGALYHKTLVHDYTVKFLDQIEELKQFPVKYAGLVHECAYVRAATLLVHAHLELQSEALRGIGALSQLGRKIAEEREILHKVLVEVLHHIIYLKSDAGDSLALVVAVDDDGKPGFTRTLLTKGDTMAEAPSTSATATSSGIQHSGAQSNPNAPTSTSVNQREVLPQLIAALIALERTKPALNTILTRIRPELRALIHDLLQQLSFQELNLIFSFQRAPRTTTSAALGASKKIFSQTSAAANKSAVPTDMPSLLKLLFKKCKAILTHHSTVIGEFRAKAADLDSLGTARTPATSSRATTSHSTSYTMEHVWIEFLKELQLLLGHYLGAQREQSLIGSIAPTSDPNAGSGGGSGSASARGRLFSFAGSSAFTQYEDEGTAAALTYADVLVDESSSPSPYHLPPVYALLVRFNESVVKIAAARDPSALLGLHKWVDELVASTFLKFIKSDYKRRLDGAMESQDAFRAYLPPRARLTNTAAPSSSSAVPTTSTSSTTTVVSALTRGSSALRARVQSALEEAPRALLWSAVEVYVMLEELHEDARELSAHAPQHAAECQRLAADVLQRYKSLCATKFQSCFGGVDKETLKLLQGNEKFRLTIMTDPRFANKFSNERVAASHSGAHHSGAHDGVARASSRQNNAFFQQQQLQHIVSKDEREEQVLFEENERVLERPMYLGQRCSNPLESLRQEHLTIESSALAHLALLHDSLLWLVGRSELLDRLTSSSKTTSSSSSSSSNTSSSSTKVSPMFMQQRKTAKAAGAGGDPSLGLSAETWRHLRELRSLAEQCLLALRTELRLWAFVSLDSDLRKTSFVFDMEYDREPHSFAAELGHHYARAHALLAAHLPRAKIAYLFAPLPALVSRLFVSALVKMSAVNVHGVSKIKRDTFFLAQVFQNIVDLPEQIDQDFEHVRKYYDLLALGNTRDLLASLATLVAERSCPFSRDEVLAAVAFLSPQRTVPPPTKAYIENLFAETYAIGAPHSPPPSQTTL